MTAAVFPRKLPSINVGYGPEAAVCWCLVQEAGAYGLRRTHPLGSAYSLEHGKGSTWRGSGVGALESPRAEATGHTWQRNTSDVVAGPT